MVVQPPRRPTGPAGCIDDEIGRECDLRIVVSDAHARDRQRISVGQIPGDPTTAAQLDVLDDSETLANDVFEQRAARTVRRKALAGVCQKVPAVVFSHVGAEIDHEPALGEYTLTETGEEVFERRAAGFEHHVGMLRLGRAVTRHWFVRERVPFEDDDLVERVRENAGGRKAGNAPTNDDGALTHGRDPFWIVPLDFRERHLRAPPLHGEQRQTRALRRASHPAGCTSVKHFATPGS